MYTHTYTHTHTHIYIYTAGYHSPIALVGEGCMSGYDDPRLHSTDSPLVKRRLRSAGVRRNMSVSIASGWSLASGW